jgi:hypothetical protein
MMHGIFISAPHAGDVYVAERSRKGSRKLLWSIMPAAPIAPDMRIAACAVPIGIRRQAYRHLAMPKYL